MTGLGQLEVLLRTLVVNPCNASLAHLPGFKNAGQVSTGVLEEGCWQPMSFILLILMHLDQLEAGCDRRR